MTEAVLKTRIAEVIQTQQDFNETLSLQDSAERAARLLPLVQSNVLPARREALKALQKCGKAALPSIHAALDAVAFEEQRAELVRVYAEVGRDAVLSDLAEYLEREADYWLRAASSLPPRWQSEVDGSPSWHYSTTVQLMSALRKARDGASRAALGSLCRSWSGVPLMETGGTEWISEDCKKVKPQF